MTDAPYEICWFCRAIDGEHAHEPHCIELTADEPAEEHAPVIEYQEVA